MPMVRLGAADCQCITQPCTCDMKLVYDPSECPLGTKAEIYRPGSAPGTASITVVQYRCVPTSPALAGFGITPRWLLIGGLALAALWLFSGGKED
jgi:hypothetical protein